MIYLLKDLMTKEILLGAFLSEEKAIKHAQQTYDKLINNGDVIAVIEWNENETGHQIVALIHGRKKVFKEVPQVNKLG